MITVVCAIWSAVGIVVIALALFSAVSNSMAKERNIDDDIISIKRRLFKIESKLDVDCDDD